MKELSIEQKAKRYDEALKAVKNLREVNPSDEGIQNWVNENFPELKESEDESLRKAIHIYLDWLDGRKDYAPKGEYSIRDMLAWIEKQVDKDKFIEKELGCIKGYREKAIKRLEELEKQGEHLPKFRVCDTIKKSTGDIVTISEIDLKNREYRLSNTGFIPFKYEHLWELVEQKPADKVKPKFNVGDSIKTVNEAPLTITEITDSGYWSEDLFICSFDNAAKWELVEKSTDKAEPKFKVGDWMVYEENVYQIHNIGLKKYYECLRTNGTVHTFDFEYIDSKSRLWTIQDAKDGDVLVTKGDKRPFIFKGLLDSNHPNCPVAYCGIDSGNLFLVITGIYWWTDKEVEPSTKKQRDFLFQRIHEAGYMWDSESKQLLSLKAEPIDEQKVAWSEEDEKMFNSALWHIKNSCGNQGKNSGEFEVYNWLKTIKYRYLPQPKQEWSEEDKRMYRELRNLIYSTPYCDSRKELSDWLESIKDRHTWKPSEGQMEALSNALSLAKNCGEEYAFDLNTLYEQLKKLREE